MAHIVVLGSGGWGIALALSAFKCGNTVSLWTPFEREAEELSSTRESAKLLAGIKIPEEINVTTDISVADGCDMVIIATPSFAVEENAKRLSTIKNLPLVVNVAKGFSDDCKRLSTIIETELPASKVVILSGPSHAEEVARQEPTSLVAASRDLDAAEFVQRVMMSETLRIYTGDDVVGVELGGAFKNIIAVAAGVCDGMGLGDNPKAALITRGLTEIARLGVKLGAREETFAGLTGLGDLIVTCTSRHSRNNRFGNLVGKGVPVAEALATVGTVEGYHAAKFAHTLAKSQGVDMPISESVYALLYKDYTTEEVLKSLMTRPSKAEHESSWLTNRG